MREKVIENERPLGGRLFVGELECFECVARLGVERGEIDEEYGLGDTNRSFASV